MKPDEEPYPTPAWEQALDRWFVRFIVAAALAVPALAALEWLPLH